MGKLHFSIEIYILSAKNCVFPRFSMVLKLFILISIYGTFAWTGVGPPIGSAAPDSPLESPIGHVQLSPTKSALQTSATKGPRLLKRWKTCR